MKRLILLLIMAAVLVSCGKKEVKQVSLESKTSQEAFALAETVRAAFVNKDLAALKNNSTEEGYKNITATKKAFDTADLAFTPRWVEIEGSQVLLNVTWKSVWASAGRSVSDRGMAVFVMEGRPLKLSKILRANPFLYPEQ